MLSHNLAIISPFISPPLITIINFTIMSPIHQYPTIKYFTILKFSHQYLTSISRPGAASIHQYLTSTNISPVSHRYLTSISPVSHQYLTAWRRQYLTSILPSPVLSHISPCYLTITPIFRSISHWRDTGEILAAPGREILVRYR